MVKPMDKRTFVVQATWDGEAGVWVAESADVPGLITEAETPNELIKKLSVLIPELVELNHVPVVPGKPLEVVLQLRGEERINVLVAA